MNVIFGLIAVRYSSQPTVLLQTFSKTYLPLWSRSNFEFNAIAVLSCLTSSSLYFIKSSLAYLPWLMNVSSWHYLIWSPKKLSSPTILISNSPIKLKTLDIDDC